MSAAAEGNIMIEIHDSTVERVERNENGLLVVLSACVHRSKGVPGVSSGSVWSQTVPLQVQGGETESVKTPIWVVDGHVDLLGEIHDNVIPWPLSHQGPVRIELGGSEGEHIVLEGHGLNVTMLDDAKYLQEFSKEQAL